MKTCAYLTVCLCLPFVLLAEDEGAVKEKPSPDENAEAAEAVADPGFERFKTVLDRMPFGRPPPGFNPDAPGGSGDGRQDPAAAAEAAAVAEASEAEQKIVSSVRVSMLNRTADGRVFVGFTDSSSQPARNYMLELGEKREQCEWQVVSADPDNRQVTVSKGGVEVALKVGGGGAASGDKDGKPKDSKDGGNGDKPGMPLRMPPGLAQGRPPMMPPGMHAAAGGGEGKLSGLEIARMRRKERLEREMADKEQQRQAAEQAKKEREQEKREREVAAEERKEQLAQLMQIQEELRRQREEKAQREAAAAEAAAAQQQGEEQPPVEE